MIGHIRFEKLLEPHHIEPVKTRNRIVKTGAGMLMWHEEELHISSQQVLDKIEAGIYYFATINLSEKD